MSLDFKEDNLIDLCELVTDGSHHSPPSQVEGYYMASVKDMGAYKFIYSDCRKISEEDYDKLVKSGCSPKNEDILIAKDGSPLSNIFIYQEEYPMVLLSSIAIIRANKNKILPEFLKYYLENPSIKKYIQTTYTSGSVIPRIILKDFKKFPINYPDIANQKKIIGVLKSIDEKIAINEEINKNLFSIGRLIFKELILNEYSNNSHSNWVLVPFNEISTVQNGFAFKSNDYCDVGCNMIRTRDITSEGFVSNEDLINLPQSFYESKKYKNYKFERLDTITVMVGASIGKMGLITDINIPSLQNQNMWRFRSKLKNISPAFVYYYVEKINKEIINMATGSARSFYRKNLFLDYECIMPSNDYLNGINHLFNSLFDKISENVAEIDKLTKLRDTLLPKLMSGEIDVSKINCDI